MNLTVELLKAAGALQMDDFTREDIAAAFASLDADTGIALLEKMIRSPITGEWGDVVYSLRPEWRHIDRWMHLSKLHCLAAVDAILIFSAVHRLPKGADPASLHAALDFAITQWGNPRLKDAAKRIRHTWPNGPRHKNEFMVSIPLAHVADLLFRQNEKFKKGWLRFAAYAGDAPKDQQDLWRLLWEYGEKQKVVYFCDLKTSHSEMLRGLRRLNFVKALSFDWSCFAQEKEHSESEQWLYFMGAALRETGEALISLDHDFGDCFILAFVPIADVAELTTQLSLLDIRAVDFSAPTGSAPQSSSSSEIPTEFRFLISNSQSPAHLKRTPFVSDLWNGLLKCFGIRR